MALIIIILMMFMAPSASSPSGEMALTNITRFATGDFFSLVGSDCGLTRCMEASHGTALAAMGGVGTGGCTCQCRRETPVFREDQRTCINHIDDCLMASYGRGATKPQIPFVFLPLKGQIIYPSKEIMFTDVENAICAVTSAQYLSPSGWVALLDLVDNDVPFGLYRDEGSTYLQWRGSASLHARLEGRLVAVHVLCSTHQPTRLTASCAAFRVAGASHNSLLDVRSIPFQAGEMPTEPVAQSKGLSFLESLAVGVCVLLIVFLYAAGIIFYVHYKQKQKRKTNDPEMNMTNTMSSDNGSTIDSRIDMDNVRLKTNPLLNLENMRNDFLNDSALSDVSERTEDTIDSCQKFPKFHGMNSNVVSAMVHTHRKKPARPKIRATSTPERIIDRTQRRSGSPEFEKAPHSDLSIIDCSLESNSIANLPESSNGEPVIRRKLYFNPVFFEVEHLKNPPPAAVDFLIKIREVMAIAKDKMTSKRFIPMLTDIPEEELYHTIDLGWDIPCARRGRRFSAISLKRENSRRAIHCGGCPGCDSSDKSQKAYGLTRSNSCKTCVSDDYKQRIVQKWLEEVPTPPQTIKPIKSIVKVNGIPRVLDQIKRDDTALGSVKPIRKEGLHLYKNECNTMIDCVSQQHGNYIMAKNVRTEKKEEKLKCQSKLNAEKDKSDIGNISPPSHKKSHEKRSPPNEATRRIIRKKLPPPPPPPPIKLPEVNKTEGSEPISLEVKKNMEAVIKQLNKCKRDEEDEVVEPDPLSSAPKIIIPVIAADSEYFSDDNVLLYNNRNSPSQNNFVEFDSLERNMLRRRRFSLDFGAAVDRKEQNIHSQVDVPQRRLSQSWRDMKKAVDNCSIGQTVNLNCQLSNAGSKGNVFINSIEPLYGNVPKPGSLTIEVRGSPIDKRNNVHEDFDPDTLDRKPKREVKKCVEKIVLKSGGSFKEKAAASKNGGDSVRKTELKTPPESVFTRKIGSLRQIYEAKTKFHNIDGRQIYERRGSAPYLGQDLAAFESFMWSSDFMRQKNIENDPKPPIPPNQRRGPEKYSPLSERQRSEERDRLPPYVRGDNLNVRKSGRRSTRTRSRRVDLRRLCRTEDSGYLSTDSNESKCRARYLMQMRPKFAPSEPVSKPSIEAVRTITQQIESDTDELESLCDGRSESGGESVETDSVFFGNFDETKELYAELGLASFEPQHKMAQSQEQIDSGFAGETNITLSGDSDSEHRSVISIVTGRDGRASAASIAQLDDPPYIQSVEC